MSKDFGLRLLLGATDSRARPVCLRHGGAGKVHGNDPVLCPSIHSPPLPHRWPHAFADRRDQLQVKTDW